jgi:type II secretory pathway pseudopilin PulG
MIICVVLITKFMLFFDWCFMYLKSTNYFIAPKMPRSRPITRSSNKNPLEVTLLFLEERAKYLQRCLRRSEQKNSSLEGELSQVLQEISQQKEQFQRLSSLHDSRGAVISLLQQKISSLQQRNQELESQILRYRRSSGTFSSSSGPWLHVSCPPFDKDGLPVGYKWVPNLAWCKNNPNSDPGPPPLDYEERVILEHLNNGTFSRSESDVSEQIGNKISEIIE